MRCQDNRAFSNNNSSILCFLLLTLHNKFEFVATAITRVSDRQRRAPLDPAWDPPDDCSLPIGLHRWPGGPLRSLRILRDSPPRPVLINIKFDTSRKSTSLYHGGLTCSQIAVLLPRPSFASRCGLAAATLMMRPYNSLWSMLSMASFASCGTSNSTYPNPR